MLRSMIVGLDGTEYSHSAMELGIQWSARLDAMVVGLGVVDPAEVRKPEMVPLGAGYYKEHGDEVRMHQTHRRVQGYLEQFSLRCAAAEVTAKVLEEEGAPVDVILREAQRYDLILMGQRTQFHDPTREGSDDTLKRVIRSAPRPVVVVPRQLTTGKITLVAFDGGVPTARALLAFQASGLANFGELHVLTVNDDHEAAARVAGRAVDFLAQHDILARTHIASPVAGGVGATILQFAEKLQAGLTVIGAYGQSTLKEFFFGSVTRTLLEESKTPLFVFH